MEGYEKNQRLFAKVVELEKMLYSSFPECEFSTGVLHWLEPGLIVFHYGSQCSERTTLDWRPGRSGRTKNGLEGGGGGSKVKGTSSISDLK